MVIFSEALSYTEAWNMTFIERRIFIKVLRNKFDQKSGKPKAAQL